MTTDDAAEHIVFEVPPQSRVKLRGLAGLVRKFVPVLGPYFPIVDVIELRFAALDEPFAISLDVRETEELGGDHAQSIPSERLIMVRKDVYRGACEDRGRDRFTLAHELGHVLLHPDAVHARRCRRQEIKAYCNSEWQANAFAAELLMPVEHIHLCSSIADVMRIFGVSHDAANYQVNEIYLREGFIKQELPDE